MGQKMYVKLEQEQPLQLSATQNVNNATKNPSGSTTGYRNADTATSMYHQHESYATTNQQGAAAAAAGTSYSSYQTQNYQTSQHAAAAENAITNYSHHSMSK
jgi:hypothetical protein